MKIVVFGLTVSSSWGNGHASLWRGLIKALAARGHVVVFFERDVPYYAAHRDIDALPSGRLHMYREWGDALPIARRELHDADVAIVTSSCPDGIAASTTVLASRAALKTFYDIGTPVTLARVRNGLSVPWLPRRGLGDFDLVFSATGGAALDALRTELGARRVATLYPHADVTTHAPGAAVDRYRGDLSYLGSYAADRQPSLERLFGQVARALPERRFIVGGGMYPATIGWSDNVHFVQQVPRAEHPEFFASSPLTLNVTRGPMQEMGCCPSSRLFEATACGAAVISDAWDGIEHFFVPGEEIFVARTTEDVVAALALSPSEIARVARAGHERTLARHTAAHRALDFEASVNAALDAKPARAAYSALAGDDSVTQRA